MDYGTDINDKINEIIRINESGDVYDIIQRDIEGKSRYQKLKILNDWKTATEKAILVDIKTEETASELNDLIEGLLSMHNSSPSPPRIRRRRTPRSRTPSASPTTRRLRNGLPSRSRSPVRRHHSRSHRSRGGKGHRKTKKLNI